MPVPAATAEIVARASGLEGEGWTTYYIVAETICPACLGRCRARYLGREGEPDYCMECGGHGRTARRVNLRDALRELGVAVAETAAPFDRSRDVAAMRRALDDLDSGRCESCGAEPGAKHSDYCG